jgi:hypothetical protein
MRVGAADRLLRPAADRTPRPTMVHVNGYDSNIQEMYFAHGPAALRRGYDCLLFDGPGQGRNLIRDGIPIPTGKMSSGR